MSECSFQSHMEGHISFGFSPSILILSTTMAGKRRFDDRKTQTSLGGWLMKMKKVITENEPSAKTESNLDAPWSDPELLGEVEEEEVLGVAEEKGVTL